MKNQLKKFDATKFEVLETKGEVLKGGFSVALSTSSAGGLQSIEDTTNSGNCVAGCGTGQTINKFICAKL
jgi:hypothetical protein